MSLKSKNLKLKVNIMMVYAVAFCLIAVGCSDKIIAPVNELTEIFVQLQENIIGESFENFIASYSEWELIFIDYHHQRRNILIFAFNGHVIEDVKFVEMLQNDDRVIRADFEPFVDEILTVFTARLYDHVIDEVFEDFLLTYNEFDLEMLHYHHQPSNTITFSFNSYYVDKIDFLESVRNDASVQRAEFEPFIDWTFGELTIHLYKDINADEFLLSYTEWELLLKEYYDIQSNIINFSFNYELIDEMLFITMLRNDHRVRRAEFKPFNSDYPVIILTRIDNLDDIDYIVEKYSEYNFNLKVKTIHELIAEQTNEVVFTFNQSSDVRLIFYFFLHEPKTGPAELLWSNLVTILLRSDLAEQELEEFWLSYASWELKIRSISPYTGYKTCVFNQELIGVYEMREMLINDNRVIRADFEPISFLVGL